MRTASHHCDEVPHRVNREADAEDLYGQNVAYDTNGGVQPGSMGMFHNILEAGPPQAYLEPMSNHTLNTYHLEGCFSQAGVPCEWEIGTIL
jgi:hypothetical protein